MATSEAALQEATLFVDEARSADEAEADPADAAGGSEGALIRALDDWVLSAVRFVSEAPDPAAAKG